MDILIVKLSSLGDVVQGLVVVGPLKEAFPNSRIHWLVEEPYSAIVACHKGVDEVLVWTRRRISQGFLDKRERSQNQKGILELVRSLRRGYDIAIDIQGLFKSGIWMGLVRAERKLGFSDPRERWNRLFTKERFERASVGTHAVEQYLGIVSALGGKVPRVPTFGVNPPQEAFNRAQWLLMSHGWEKGEPIAVIVTGARWESKKWEPWGFSQVADHLRIQMGFLPVFVGSKWEKRLVREIMAQMRSRAVDLSGTTDLATLASLMSLAKVAVCTDSGAMHVAVAMDTPVVALFGPTAPWKTGPYGERHVVVRVPMDCSPCFKRKCSSKGCMKSIAPSDVVKEVERVVQRVQGTGQIVMGGGAQ